ncbi:uncharacterized protein LOC142547964 [Primulina tabacum]|uniref:uncharacterized protein LOC142547964 n=1 Tax=Primulina tabacum TaxID=48773 RepID=UPI003F59C389
MENREIGETSRESKGKAPLLGNSKGGSYKRAIGIFDVILRISAATSPSSSSFKLVMMIFPLSLVIPSTATVPANHDMRRTASRYRPKGPVNCLRYTDIYIGYFRLLLLRGDSVPGSHRELGSQLAGDMSAVQ